MPRKEIEREMETTVQEAPTKTSVAPDTTPVTASHPRKESLGAPSEAKRFASLRNHAELAVFLEKKFPPSEPLVEGLLNRREFAGLIGRRRHGKTTILLNLALALSEGKPEFLGYPIPAKRRVVAFFLEDDPYELQLKLRTMIRDGAVPSDFYIYTKDDFYAHNIPIDIDESNCQEFVKESCKESNPDLIIFDNLAHLVRGDYNNSNKIDTLVRFAYNLQTTFNAAVVMAAHPRKRGNEENLTVSLEFDAEAFFEECMGSSHFINSTGTLWGIQRVRAKEKTIFVGGTQRRDGSQGLTPLDMADGWFVVRDDFQDRLDSILNTDKRRAAWELLPNDGSFTRAEAERIVKPHLKHASFVAWWNELVRLEVIVPTAEGKFQKKGSPLA